ncbi:MAG: alpha/beta hydrolase [Clostridiaceae bacterium]|nr:alpha/beta hydrolase [Clostridiaceae bacterium]
MEEKCLHTPRGDVWYWISHCTDVTAPCLVLTHGMTVDHTMFEPQEKHFADDCTILAWDVPLHGKSRPYRDFSYENVAGDLAAILETEEIQKAVLVGMSMGGFIVQELIARRPELAAGFVALDTAPLGNELYSAFDRFWLRRTGAVARLYPDRLLRAAIANNTCASESARRKMLEMITSSTKDEICRQMELVYGAFPVREQPVNFPCPVRLMLGQYDKTGKVRQYNVNWARRTGFPLEIISNAAHFSNWDNPNAVNRAIEGIFRTIEEKPVNA